MGLLVRVLVHPANIQERDGARMLLQPQPQLQPSWQLMWVEGGYSGPDFANWVQKHCDCRVEVVRKDPEQRGFAALPRGRPLGRGCGTNFCMVRTMPAIEQRLRTKNTTQRNLGSFGNDSTYAQATLNTLQTLS